MKATLDFGSERQPQELLVDTGSSWTWTYADNCMADSIHPACRKTKKAFHAVESETFQATGDVKFIQYGKGSVRGDIVKDTISMGFDAAGDEVKADDFHFFIDYMKNGNTKSQGILGLSPHDDSSGPLLVEQMYQ